MSETGSPAGGDTRALQPSRKLPTTRAGFSKQLDALRAYALLSANGSAAVRYPKVGETIKIHESNVSSMNPFFLENGFIEKSGNGYVPHSAVLEFNRAYSWNADTAGQKLAPLLRDSWFAQALVHRISFRAMPEDEAIEILASACNAGPEAKLSLKILIDYLEVAGLVRRENGSLSAQMQQVERAPIVEPPPAPVEPAPVSSDSRPAPKNMAEATKGGAISFQINVNVDMAEIASWPADRITAFFSGVAQVIAAQQKT